MTGAAQSSQASIRGRDSRPPQDYVRAYGNPPKSSSSVCILCRGTKMLCGKSRCPVLMRFYSGQKTRQLETSTDMTGNSPPAVFIGRFGYPKVHIGPLVPPISGDTSVMDIPEQWYGRPIEEIVDFRSSLVRGMHPVRVDDVEARDKIVSLTRELALARASPQVEAAFEKPPRGRLSLDDEVQPHGPSAHLKKIEVDNIKMDHRIERAFYDTDLKSRDGAVELYRSGTLVSQIQKAFSVGALGQGKRRKFVPTRWSITAVDSMLGEDIMKRTKLRPTIDEYRVYESHHLDNRWAVMFMPSEWCYELIEAWYPDTAWNPQGRSIAIFSDFEFHKGRTEYARIGGCYYAARLAVNEKLEKERRQAGAVIFREAHPGYIMPVGVWNVRENVRAALRTEPSKYETLPAALGHVERMMDIPLSRWIKVSGILKDRLYQRRLDDW